jgi:hypothetical protein
VYQVSVAPCVLVVYITTKVSLLSQKYLASPIVVLLFVFPGLFDRRSENFPKRQLDRSQEIPYNSGFFRDFTVITSSMPNLGSKVCQYLWRPFCAAPLFSFRAFVSAAALPHPTKSAQHILSLFSSSFLLFRGILSGYLLRIPAPSKILHLRPKSGGGSLSFILFGVVGAVGLALLVSVIYRNNHNAPPNIFSTRLRCMHVAC